LGYLLASFSLGLLAVNTRSTVKIPLEAIGEVRKGLQSPKTCLKQFPLEVLTRIWTSTTLLSLPSKRILSFLKAELPISVILVKV